MLVADNQNDPRIEGGGPDPSPLGLFGFAPDAILDFNGDSGLESLDLADILDGSPGSENIDSYIMAIGNGVSSTLLVDTRGTGNFFNPDLVFEIDGVNWDSARQGQLAGLVKDAVIIVA